MESFIDFIRERAVVGLAIGFVLGGAVSGLVNSFINDIINPLIGPVLGQVHGLKGAYIPFFGAEIVWGNFLITLINFFIMTAVVYFGFKILGLEKLDKKKEESFKF
ncbi:MAG: MscL family protein [Patescibacteria group bacterium]